MLATGCNSGFALGHVSVGLLQACVLCAIPAPCFRNSLRRCIALSRSHPGTSFALGHNAVGAAGKQASGWALLGWHKPDQQASPGGRPPASSGVSFWTGGWNGTGRWTLPGGLRRSVRRPPTASAAARSGPSACPPPGRPLGPGEGTPRGCPDSAPRRRSAERGRLRVPWPQNAGLCTCLRGRGRYTCQLRQGLLEPGVPPGPLCVAVPVSPARSLPGSLSSLAWDLGKSVVDDRSTPVQSSWPCRRWSSDSPN